MKQSELVIGTEYAVKHLGYQMTHAKFLGIETTKTTPKWSGQTASTSNQPKFEVVTKNGYGCKAGDVFLSSGRYVQGTWQEHIQRQERIEAQKVAEQEREKAAVAAIERLVSMLNSVLYPSPAIEKICGHRYGGESVSLDVTWRDQQVELKMSAGYANAIADLLQSHGVGQSAHKNPNTVSEQIQ